MGRGRKLLGKCGRKVVQRRLGYCWHHIGDNAVNDDKLQREKGRKGCRVHWLVVATGVAIGQDKQIFAVARSCRFLYWGT